MKKLLLLILGFFSFGANAQTYKPFPTETDSIVWKNLSHFWGNYTSSFIYISDTIHFNNKEYSKVYQGVILLENDSNNVIAHIREENKVIYRKSGNSEYILYDFNLNVGDTLFGNNENAEIVKIDSVKLLNNEFRKRYKLYGGSEVNFGDTIVQVEGLGNIKNGFLAPLGISYTDGSEESACIFSPSEILYKSSLNEDCEELNNSTSIKTVDNTSIIVSPNPFSQFIYFSETLKTVTLSVYSIKGELILQENNFSGNEVDVSELISGVYFLKIEGESVSGFVKIIKE